MSLIARIAELTDCVICLEPFEKVLSFHEKKKKLDCSHIFHKECIDKWLTKAETYSLCCAVVNTPEEESALRWEKIRKLSKKIDQAIQEIPRMRRVNLNENSSVADKAKKAFLAFKKIFSCRVENLG